MAAVCHGVLTHTSTLVGHLDAVQRGKAGVGVSLAIGPTHRSVDFGAGTCGQEQQHEAGGTGFNGAKDVTCEMSG
jgi:hypothetical protein